MSWPPHAAIALAPEMLDRMKTRSVYPGDSQQRYRGEDFDGGFDDSNQDLKLQLNFAPSTENECCAPRV